MGIEININKDVGSYDAKLIGPFTARQSICVVIAAPICWAIYTYTAPLLTPDVAGFLTAIPAGIAYLFGWLKPYGMRTEKFVQSVFINMVLAPSHRKYMTVNVHEKAFAVLARHAKKVEEEDSDQTNSKKSKKQAQKKTAYKVSPDAVR